MQDVFDISLAWWITGIEVPAMTALFWMIWRTRKESEQAIRTLADVVSAFKLEVVKNYAATTDLKDLEIRIVNHLLRIEAKLDQTALKTEALKAETKHNLHP